MATCPKCGQTASAEARFCGVCGTPFGAHQARALPPRRIHPGRTPSREWVSLDDVIYTRDRRLGAIGVLLAFFGAFAPWSNTAISFLGFQVGSYGSGAQQGWVLALAAIAAAVFLFRHRSGSVVLVIGVAVAAWAVLFALTTLSGNASPSWGVALTAAGGAMLAYSGHMANQYEGR